MTNVEKKSIFFATSFSGHVDYNTGRVHEDFQERIQRLLGVARATGKFTVYCAVEAEGWKIATEAPGVSMAKNFEEIEKRDIFLALVDKVGSDGRGVEVDYAYNAGKEVILTTGPDEELSWVMQELVALGRAQHISYDQPEDLAQKLGTL